MKSGTGQEIQVVNELIFQVFWDRNFFVLATDFPPFGCFHWDLAGAVVNFDIMNSRLGQTRGFVGKSSCRRWNGSRESAFGDNLPSFAVGTKRNCDKTEHTRR